MRGRAEELRRRAGLDDTAREQHRHPVADAVDHGEIVADQQVGEAQPILQLAQEVQHLRLHRHVERADRLVGDDQLRARDQRARDRDALALATRELVRVLVEVRGTQPDRDERVGDPLAPLGGHDATDRGQRLGSRVSGSR